MIGIQGGGRSGKGWLRLRLRLRLKLRLRLGLRFLRLLALALECALRVLWRHALLRPAPARGAIRRRRARLRGRG